MSAEGHRDVIRRLYAAIDANDHAGLDGVLAPDYRCHMGGGGPMDREGFKQFVAAFVSALPDIRHTVDDTLVEGDRGALRLRVQGTQRGELMGIPPTGKQVTINAINVMHFREGKIAEHWIEADILGLLQQLGAVPGPG
jgi:predicted ester cyclase